MKPKAIAVILVGILLLTSGLIYTHKNDNDIAEDTSDSTSSTSSDSKPGNATPAPIPGAGEDANSGAGMQDDSVNQSDDCMGVCLFTDKDTYLPGENVTIILKNMLLDNIEVGACVDAVYRWDGSSWTYDQRLSPGLCVAIAYVVKPGGNFTYAISLDGARPGLYRVSVTVLVEAKSYYRITVNTTFTVEPRDKPVIVLDKRTYSPSDVVNITVLNPTNHTLTITGLQIEQHSREGWVVDENLTTRVRAGEAFQVEPGGESIIRLDLSDAKPGLYRVTLTTSLDGRDILLTATFIIEHP